MGTAGGTSAAGARAPPAVPAVGGASLRAGQPERSVPLTPTRDARPLDGTDGLDDATLAAIAEAVAAEEAAEAEAAAAAAGSREGSFGLSAARGAPRTAGVGSGVPPGARVAPLTGGALPVCALDFESERSPRSQLSPSAGAATPTAFSDLFSRAPSATVPEPLVGTVIEFLVRQLARMRSAHGAYRKPTGAQGECEAVLGFAATPAAYDLAVRLRGRDRTMDARVGASVRYTVAPHRYSARRRAATRVRACSCV